MQKHFFYTCLFTLFSIVACAQKPANWTSDQLMEPAELAQLLSTDKSIPTIISVGPGAPIPHSTHVGMVKDKEALDAMKQTLGKLDKKATVVVYCGCCPFEHCPNVRPAIDLLRSLQFTNYRLLNLPHNIKTDWIDKGFPVKKD